MKQYEYIYIYNAGFTGVYFTRAPGFLCILKALHFLRVKNNVRYQAITKKNFFRSYNTYIYDHCYQKEKHLKKLIVSGGKEVHHMISSIPPASCTATSFARHQY